MGVTPELSSAELQAITDPAALLDRAWDLEPFFRWPERMAILDRLEELLAGPGVPPAPPERDWRLELLAERAVLLASANRLEEALDGAEQVLREAEPAHAIALGRALLAKGQVLSWTGTNAATREADRALMDAAERFSQLGHREWHGSALLRCGFMVWFQSAGWLPRAQELMREALEVWGPDSVRRGAALSGYADVLLDLGEIDAADAILDEATAEAELPGAQPHAGAFLDWTRARAAAARGDAFTTERLLREVERRSKGEPWFDTHVGSSFYLDAAELLDKVGLRAQAEPYFERGQELSEDNLEAVIATRALLLARGGDPLEALDAMQEIVRGDWLEKRMVWRYTMLTAWAAYRAGRAGAGELVARALEQAIACGGLRVAQAGEPELTAALAPLAEAAGSSSARELMLEGRELVVRLFGTPSVIRADGTVAVMPIGKPGELVRMLALHEHGLPVDVVLEAFFPEAPASAARQRLRQVLTRLRSAAGEVVVRDGEQLRLLPAWVDVREFLVAADRVRGKQGPKAVQLAYAALALHGGPLLPTDPYAEWSLEHREQVEYRHLTLLDLVAGDASRRGSHQEALTALDAAVNQDPNDMRRYSAIADQLLALGRNATAEYLARRAGANMEAAG